MALSGVSKMFGWLFKSKNAKTKKAAAKTPTIKGKVSDWKVGEVKVYIPKKRFGFVQIPNVEKDVFLHASVLPAGVTTLAAGTKVKVKYGQAEKGLQVTELILV